MKYFIKNEQAYIPRQYKLVLIEENRVIGISERNCIHYQEKQEMIQEQKKLVLTDVLQLTHLMKQSENKTMKILIEGALLHLEADIKWLDMIERG